MVAVMMRRRHLTATAHQVASIPLALADHARMRLGGNGCECCGADRQQNERYEFAHGSILQRLRKYLLAWSCFKPQADQGVKRTA